jgi:uncharacterized membrane protein
VIEVLAFATTVVCALLALVLPVLAGRYRWRRVPPYLVVIEAALVVQAIAVVISRFGGYSPRESAENWAYVVTSLVLIPLVAPFARRDRWWSAVLLAITLVVLAIVVVRMQTTWRH